MFNLWVVEFSVTFSANKMKQFLHQLFLHLLSERHRMSFPCSLIPFWALQSVRYYIHCTCIHIKNKLHIHVCSPCFEASRVVIFDPQFIWFSFKKKTVGEFKADLTANRQSLSEISNLTSNSPKVIDSPSFKSCSCFRIVFQVSLCCFILCGGIPDPKGCRIFLALRRGCE